MAMGDEVVLPVLRRGLNHAAHAASALGYQFLPHAVSDWRGVEVQRNIPYLPGGGRDHQLDVYRPKGASGPLPTIMYLHGGAFSMMSKDTHQIMAYVLASKGYLVFNVNYRQGPKFHYPAPLEDANTALLWILDHGAEHGADLGRLAIMGDSAGANLTAAVTYCATHPRPEPFAAKLFERAPEIRCSAPVYGVLDVEDVERLWRDPRKSRRMPGWIKGVIRGTARSYLGPEEHPLGAPLASPLRLFEERPSPQSRPLPAFFTTVGTADPLLSDSLRLREALQARGTECELHVFRGEIHAFNVFLWRRAARDHWSALFRFLGRHMDVHAVRVTAHRKTPSYVSLAQLLAE